MLITALIRGEGEDYQCMIFHGQNKSITKYLNSFNHDCNFLRLDVDSSHAALQIKHSAEPHSIL